MKNALGFFLNLLVMMIILKIFAPMLADQLVDIVGKLLAVINQLLDSFVEQSQQSEALSMLLVYA